MVLNALRLCQCEKGGVVFGLLPLPRVGSSRGIPYQSPLWSKTWNACTASAAWIFCFGCHHWPLTLLPDWQPKKKCLAVGALFSCSKLWRRRGRPLPAQLAGASQFLHWFLSHPTLLLPWRQANATARKCFRLKASRSLPVLTMLSHMHRQQLHLSQCCALWDRIRTITHTGDWPKF